MDYEKIHKLVIEKGFFSPSCEIYSDAPAGFWEYGPLGLQLRNNYIELWRKFLVRRDNMLEIDGTQIMSESVFKASGHLDNFTDPIVNCSKCGSVYRADKLISDVIKKELPERLEDSEYFDLIKKHSIKCIKCKSDFENVSRFNMMFKVGIGPKGDNAFLRPETCQSIFVDYQRLSKTMRIKLPVGFAQFGKSFRNEISPRQSLIRLREFYQAEIEVLFNPSNVSDFKKFDKMSDIVLTLQIDEKSRVTKTVKEFVDDGLIPNRFIGYYLALVKDFYDQTGIPEDCMRFRKLSDQEKAFYSETAFDFEIKTSIGWIELVACNYRSDYDLKRHSEISGSDLSFFDDSNKFIPHVFEISMGVERSIYCILENCFKTESERNLLKIPFHLSSIKVAVFPLVNKDGIPQIASDLHDQLKMHFSSIYDASGSIGRRYRRQDEIGTAFCVTVDYDTLNDNTVTIRNRDSMNQVRIKTSEIFDYVSKEITK